jgi:acetyl-CoA synthetase
VHTQISCPVGSPGHEVLVGNGPGDVHLNISSPGWAKHAWSFAFAPCSAEATIFIFSHTRFDPAA